MDRPENMLKPGVKVRLRWNGFSQLPHYMDGAIVTIVRGPYYSPRGGGVLYVRVAEHDGKERTVRSNQVGKVVESE